MRRAWGALGDQAAEMLTAANRADPCGRLGSPQEITETVAFLMLAEPHISPASTSPPPAAAVRRPDSGAAGRKAARLTSRAPPSHRTPGDRCRCARPIFHPTTEHERGLIRRQLRLSAREAATSPQRLRGRWFSTLQSGSPSSRRWHATPSPGSRRSGDVGGRPDRRRHHDAHDRR